MKVNRALASAAVGVGLGMILLPSVAQAAVSASVSSKTVSLTATGCAGPAGAKFTVTGPNGKSFDVDSPNSNTTRFASGGLGRGTYKFTGKCANGTSAGSGTFTLTPGGAPMGGDGGRVENGMTLLAGTALLSAAAGGYAVMRRRAKTTA